MKKSRPQVSLTLVTKETISAEMLRLWFSADDPSQFTRDNEGDYLKLMFNRDNDQPILRTFTVARVNQDRHQVAIDFALHGEATEQPSVELGGFAHYFAHTASPGDQLQVVGPNSKKSVLPSYNNTLFVADPTAIPALQSVLRYQTVSGHIVAYRCSESLRGQLQQHGLSISSADSGDDLEQRLAELSEMSFAEVWCAGEYQMMRLVRKYISSNTAIDREERYFSSYWKPGMTEDGHKAFKRANA